MSSFLGPVIAAALVIACGGTGAPPPRERGPVVAITVVHPGAAAEVVEREVVTPIEHHVSKLEGLQAVRARIDGDTAVVAVEAKPGTRIEEAAMAVRDAVEAARTQLPAEIEVPQVTKVGIEAPPAMWLELEAPRLAALELGELAERVIEPQLARLAGVGAIRVIGARRREVAVVVDPARLAASGVTIGEIASAVATYDVTVPGGRRGGPAIRGMPWPPERIAQAAVDGAGHRVADLARVEVRGRGGGDGAPVRIAIRLQQGVVAAEVLARLRAAARELPLPAETTLREIEPPRGIEPLVEARARAAFAVAVLGPDPATLAQLAARVERELIDAGVAQRVVSDQLPAAPATGSARARPFAFDRDRAASAGVTMAAFSATLRALAGVAVAQAIDDDRTMDIVLELPPDTELAAVRIRTLRGELVRIADVATEVPATAPAVISHVNLQRAITLFVETTAASAARARAAKLALPAGYQLLLDP